MWLEASNVFLASQEFEVIPKFGVNIDNIAIFTVQTDLVVIKFP